MYKKHSYIRWQNKGLYLVNYYKKQPLSKAVFLIYTIKNTVTFQPVVSQWLKAPVDSAVIAG